MRSDVFVFRLSILGLRFMPGIFGLMKDGDGGSEAIVVVPMVFVAAVPVAIPSEGGCMDRPFIFRALRGDGEVMGRMNVLGSGALSVVTGSRPATDPPNDVAG
jgi:hypothetical protein